MRIILSIIFIVLTILLIEIDVLLLSRIVIVRKFKIAMIVITIIAIAVAISTDRSGCNLIIKINTTAFVFSALLFYTLCIKYSEN